MQKVYFIQQKARRQGKRVYRVDIDLKHAFNVMSQAALWQVMKMLFKIPDVDLFEQKYEGATVRLAPNDEETPPCTWCSGEHGESTPGTCEPGVERVKGACKGEEGLVEGKAADVSTQWSLLLHWSLPHVAQGE